jgi:uncharacterized protein (DUF2062 family)
MPFMGDHAMHLAGFTGLTLESIGWNVTQYAIGAVVLALIAGVVGTSLTFVLLRVLRKKQWAPKHIEP